MTKMEMALLFGNMGAGALSSAVGANQNKKNQAQQELDAMVQRQLAALQNSQQTSQSLQDQRQQGWKDQTSQSPLGQEQSYLQKQRLAQVLFPQIANFKPAMPTDAGVAGAYVPPTNFLSALGNPKLLETFGDQATATSLADRRKLMAGLNPDYEFSSLGNFGLDSSFDQGVNRAQQDAAGRRSAYENAQTSLANQQYNLASQPQQQQQQEKNGGGVKGFLGGLLKTAAPFASFIPGVGPLAAIGLGAAGGALGNKLQGGGLVSGAAQGAIGAGVGAAGKSLAGGQGLNPFNNKAGGAMLDAAGKAVTSASQVGPFQGIGTELMDKTNFAIPAPFNATQTITGMLQQPQSSFRQLPPQTGGPSRAGGSFQIPPSQTGFQLPSQAPPMAVSHQQGQPSAVPQELSTNMFGQQRSPQLQQMLDEMMNTGIAKGYTQGGFNMGMLPGFPGVGMGAAQSSPVSATSPIPSSARPPVNSPVPMMSRNAELGAQSRNAAFDQMYKNALAAQQAQGPAAEGMMAMGRMGQNQVPNAQALNQAMQQIFKRVPGRTSQALPPDVMAKIIAAAKQPRSFK